nr:hypothetical protein [Tanacetum cinerariifolium]
MIITITHYLCNLIIIKLDGTKKFVDEIGELRAVSGHMLGASGVKIPKNNLDNLKSIREEDGTSKMFDPQDLLGFALLEILYSTISDLLLEPTNFVALGFDLLALVELITLVEGNKGNAGAF